MPLVSYFKFLSFRHQNAVPPFGDRFRLPALFMSGHRDLVLIYFLPAKQFSSFDLCRHLVIYGLYSGHRRVPHQLAAA